MSVFQVLFKANFIFKDFSRQSCIFKYFSSLCEPCVFSRISKDANLDFIYQFTLHSGDYDLILDFHVDSTSLMSFKKCNVTLFCLFDLILNVPLTIFQLNREGSSWVEPVMS